MRRVWRVLVSVAVFVTVGLAVPVVAPAEPGEEAAPEPAVAAPPPDPEASVLDASAPAAGPALPGAVAMAPSTIAPADTPPASATPSDPTTTTSAPVSRSAGSEPTTPGPGAPTPRLIAGTVADAAAWPFAVLLTYYDAGGALVGSCSGTLIDPVWVLTAAHCIEPDPGIVAVEARTEAGESSPVLGGVRHPDYAPQQRWDVGLYELATPLVATPPMALAGPEDEALTAPGTLAAVAGYGISLPGIEPDLLLRDGDTVLQPDELCEIRWPGQFSVISDLCADGVDVTAACQGDSGGPVAVLAPRGVLQVGVVSRGAENCFDEVEVYTSVLAARPWIDSVTAASTRVPPDVPDGVAVPGPPRAEPASPAQVGRIYRAVFHRWPDRATIAAWHATGLGPVALAQALMASPEGQRTFEGIADGALVFEVYWHTFDRRPGSADYDYWLRRFTGGLSQPAFVVEVADSGESVRLTGHLPT